MIGSVVRFWQAYRAHCAGQVNLHWPGTGARTKEEHKKRWILPVRVPKSLPSTTMRALIVQEDRTVAVTERPVPKIADDQILVKNTALGQNPSDWKHAAMLSPVGAIMGVDSVGTVAEIGSKVPPTARITVGQRRGLFMRGGMEFDNGPFAEYTAMDWDQTFAVPENITDEEAATLPAPLWTAIQCLYLRLGLTEPSTSVTAATPAADAPWILVWSGMSSVAQFVIQLAKLSGCRVITTASPSRWDYLKTLGAVECLDYKVRTQQLSLS